MSGKAAAQCAFQHNEQTSLVKQLCLFSVLFCHAMEKVFAYVQCANDRSSVLSNHSCIHEYLLIIDDISPFVSVAWYLFQNTAS